MHLPIPDIQLLGVPASPPPDHIADTWPVPRYSDAVPCQLWGVPSCTEA